MAYRAKALTNVDFVQELVKHGIIKSEIVRDIMLTVDRGHFIHNDPYDDRPQSIGFAATISAPHMHASALESLVNFIKPGSRVLDVGSGTGYLTACLALLAGPTGVTVGIEHIDELRQKSQQNVDSWRSGINQILNKPNLNLTPSVLNYLNTASNLFSNESKNSFKLITGDGRKGWPMDAPYNVIHVGAAAHPIPQELIDQLAVGGRLFCPEGPQDGDQYIVQIDKLEDGSLKRQKVMPVRYVPLTDEQKQRGTNNRRNEL